MDGVLNLLKPPGMTSSNAVADVRRLLQEKKAGHTGTLDPGAAGVLPICVGKATRLFDYLLEKDKVYRAEVTFGVATDTLDSYGAVTERAKTAVTEEALLEQLNGLQGTLLQIPPMYSALKHNGKKLYELARKGEAVDLQSKQREVTIHKAELIARTGPQSFLIRVSCSKGTYIRTLCQDLGLALGVPAHMSFLLRERSGGFGVGDAWTIAEVEAAASRQEAESLLVPMSEAVGFLPAAVVEDQWFDKLKNGVATPFDGESAGLLRIFCRDAFFGIGMAEDGFLRIKTMLYTGR